MRCLRLPTVLVMITGVACWTGPFNWHFLPKHYRLYSNLTADHTVQFDTDCGTLAADSGATHFLWNPASGLCSISSGLTAADFLISKKQDSKTSFYYVRDFALVVPPGSPNCPTEAQLKRMIDYLKSTNASFPVDPNLTRRTWRDECKKDENAEAMPAGSTASTESPTNKATTTANVTSIIRPDVITARTAARTSSTTAYIDSMSTKPFTSTRSTTPSDVRTPDSPTAIAATSSPMTDKLEPVSNAIITHTHLTSVTGAKTTAFIATDTTIEGNPVAATSTHTPSVITAPASSTAAATTESHSTVSYTVARNPFASDVSAKTTAFATTDTTTDRDLTTNTSQATTTSGSTSSSISTLPTTREATTKSAPTPSPSPTTSSYARTDVASSTSSVPAQEPMTTSTRAMTTNTTPSAIHPSSAKITTSGNPKTTVPNANTSTVPSTAAKTSPTTKTTTTKRTTHKLAATTRPATKATTTTKSPTPKSTTPKRTTTKKPTCKTAAKHAVPFYQAYRGRPSFDYIYTSNYSEARKTPGYTIVGRILLKPALGSTPLFRLYHKAYQSHFYTVFSKGRDDAVAHGARSEGVEGYVYETSANKKSCPCAEVRPLYRLVKYAPTAKYFYTTDIAEKVRAERERYYEYEEIAACIYPK